MKRITTIILILIALFVVPLNADDPVYPNWEWMVGHWVYTGNEFPAPIPPPNPPEIG